MITDKTIEYQLGAKIDADVPPEPVYGSVVIDRHGIAFQRFGTKWSRAGAPLFAFAPPEAKALGFTWRALLVYRGAVTLVYVPPAKEER